MLMLGGTGFLGPHVVEAAVAAGYEVTLLNRGKTNPHLFPDLEKLVGDRNGDLGALKGRKFDVVVDTSGYFPRQVETSAKAVAEHAQQYLFVSTVSVYDPMTKLGIDESSPTAPMPEPYSEEMPTYYGALKAGCERAAEAAMPGRVTVVRPGLIVGPRDPTDRFTYWPVRIARGGQVLAPGNPDDPVQFVDVRDLADFMIRTLQKKHLGLHNVVGPEQPMAMGELLKTCQEVSGSQIELSWVDAEFLAEQEVMPWMHMPVWVPPEDPEHRGLTRIDNAKAIAAGLSFRTPADTVQATLAWWNEQPQERRDQMRAGVTTEREQAVLQAWQAHEKGATHRAA